MGIVSYCQYEMQVTGQTHPQHVDTRTSQGIANGGLVSTAYEQSQVIHVRSLEMK